MAKAKSSSKNIRLTLLKSRFGRTPGHAECAQGLGLRNRHQTVEVLDTPENRGMIEKMAFAEMSAALERHTDQ